MVTLWHIDRTKFDASPIIHYTLCNFTLTIVGNQLMSTTARKQLVDRVAEKTKSKRVTVKAVVQQLLEEITTELSQNNRQEFRDFGVFEPRTRAARTAQNPKTLKKVQVPAKRTAKLKMGRMMRERLSDGVITHG
jgi:integration host factor subunit beta